MIKIKNRYFERIEDTSQFNEDFIKNYNEESHEGYFLEFDVLYPEKLHDLHNDLSFFPERMKIEKVEKFVANSHDKTEYVIHTKNLKQALNHRSFWKNLHRILHSNKGLMKMIQITHLKKKKMILKKIL